MCKFFSFLSNGRWKYLYFDWEERKALLESNPDDLDPDSHSSIAEKFGAVEDRLNKYEYNPLTGEFIVDQINAKRDDHVDAEKWVKKLDFKTIVEPLIIKKIVHPFRDFDRDSVTDDEIELLRQWASVGDSVRASVWACVRASVRACVGDSVWACVRASVRACVGDSVRASVRACVRDSVWDSVWAYISSFFSIKYRHDYSSCVKLWESGLVPSFGGKSWRLHGGKNAAVLYQIDADKLVQP